MRPIRWLHPFLLPLLRWGARIVRTVPGLGSLARWAVARAEGREQVGVLRDGTPVFSRIDEDHLAAHPEATGLLRAALAAIDRSPVVGEYASFVHEFDHAVGTLTCVPIADQDEILYARRVGRREGLTRFVRGREGLPCRSFVVWLRTTRTGVVVLTTAYVGRITPQEPWHPRARASVATWEASVAFWSGHALVWDGDVEADPPPGPEASTFWGERPAASGVLPFDLDRS